MKKDLSKPILDFDGKEVKDGEKTVTLASVSINALLSPVVGDKLDGAESFRRWELAQKIKKTETDCELTAEEIALVKSQIGKLYAPIVTGFVWSSLEK